MEIKTNIENVRSVIDDTCVAVNKLLEENTQETVAEAFGISLDAVKRHSSKMLSVCNILGLSRQNLISFLENEEYEMRELNSYDMIKSRCESYEKVIASQRKMLESAQMYSANIVKALVAEIGVLKPISKPDLTFCKDSEHNETAMLTLSDWQVGSNFSEEDTSGLASASTDLLIERVNLLTKKTIQLVELQRNAVNIQNLVINALGDFVEGEKIFDSQGVYIDDHSFGQFSTCISMFETMIKTFLEKFNKVTMYAVFGNHGRMGRKGEQHQQNNWDFLLYMFLKERFRDEERFEIFVSTSSWLGYVIQDAPEFNHVILHGDRIPNTLGIPWYGINREAAKISTILDMPVHYITLGHFHQGAELSASYGCKIINGSLVGTSPFASNMWLSSLPMQKLWGLHPGIGKTWTYDIYLGKKPNIKPDNKGLITTYVKR